MSQKSVNGSYWQTPPGARNQILLIPISLEERIPDKHPVRLLDEILDGPHWKTRTIVNTYNRKLGQPPELAELTTRRTKMNEVLEQLREMDLGADFARNRIRDVDCGSILPDCPMPRTISVEHFVSRMGTNEYFIKPPFGCPHSVDNPHTGRTCCQIMTRK